MFRSSVRRVTMLSALILLLAAVPASHAAPRQVPSTALSRLWTRLTSLLGEIGCVIDPGGICRASKATQGEIGCIMDPGGSCHTSAATQGDIGCIADPHGCDR